MTSEWGTAPAPDELTAPERLSVDELRACQLSRLQWTLQHAYDNVPFYRKKFDEAGIAPQDCRELADLADYPVTTKQDLRDNYPFGMFAVPRSGSAASTHPAAPPVNPRSSATPTRTSTRGPP